jgi:hypothetical protein
MPQALIPPNQYAAFFTNYNPNQLQTQLPPITISNYTIGTSNYWTYHIGQKIWHEVDQESYARIQKAGNVVAIDYSNSTMPTWSYQNKTTVDFTQAGGNIQVFWDSIPSTTLDSSMYNGVPFSQAKYPGSAFINEAKPLGLLVQQGAGFIPLWSDQVILEPINTGGNITWMATTVARLQSRVINKQLKDPVSVTGYVAIFKNGVWSLARNSLNGTGLNRVNNFASIIISPMLPPGQIGSRSLQTGSNRTCWAYHIAHMVWYEVDLDSYTRIQSNNISTNIKSKSSYIIQMLNTNKTATLDPKTSTNISNIEIFSERVSGTPPKIDTVSYPGQTVGTFLNGNSASTVPGKPENIFGTADALLPAFNCVPKANDGVVFWDYNSNEWRAFHKDQLIAEINIESGKIIYSPTPINLALLTGRTSVIDSLAKSIESSIDNIIEIYIKSKKNNDIAANAWKTAGLSVNRIQEAQIAADLVNSAMQAIQNIYHNLQNNFNGIVNINNTYTQAKINSDLNGLYDICVQLNTLEASCHGLITQAKNYLLTSDTQTSIAVNGKPPTNIFTQTGSFFQSLWSGIANNMLNIYVVLSKNFNASIFNQPIQMAKNFFIYISGKANDLVAFVKSKFR